MRGMQKRMTAFLMAVVMTFGQTGVDTVFAAETEEPAMEMSVPAAEQPEDASAADGEILTDEPDSPDADMPAADMPAENAAKDVADNAEVMLPDLLDDAAEPDEEVEDSIIIEEAIDGGEDMQELEEPVPVEIVENPMPANIIVCSNESQRRVIDGQDAYLEAEFIRPEAFRDDLYGWVEVLSGDELAGDLESLSAFLADEGLALGDGNFAVWAGLLTGDGQEAHGQGSITVRFYKDNIDGLVSKQLYHWRSDGSWENLPFMYAMSSDDEWAGGGRPFVEFTTSSLSSFIFTDLVEKQSETDADDGSDTDADNEEGGIFDGMDADGSGLDIFVEDMFVAESSETNETDAETEFVAQPEEQWEAPSEAMVAEEVSEVSDVSDEDLDAKTPDEELAETESESGTDEEVPFEEELETEFGTEKLETETEDLTETETESAYFVGEKVYENDEVIVKVDVSAESKIPADAVFVVEKIDESSGVYREYFEKLQAFYGVSGDALEIVPYDVHFEYNGEKIEPVDGQIDVDFRLKTAMEVEGNASVSVCHIMDDGEVDEVVADALTGD